MAFKSRKTDTVYMKDLYTFPIFSSPLSGEIDPLGGGGGADMGCQGE